ncbi:M61 family metallopeptidase [Paraglaciecola aestuariivivens]
MSNDLCPIHYQVSIASLAGHLFNVRLDIQHPNPEGQLLTLPAWIPGSYMIRDFAKNIVQISAVDEQGQPLTIKKVDKQSFKIQPSLTPISVTYQVYAFDLSVRGAYINDEIAFFNGTNLFLAVEGQSDLPCQMSLIKPSDSSLSHWQVATTMPCLNQKQEGFCRFKAQDYQDLVDHPVLIGEFERHCFNTSGVEFELVLAGGHQADVSRITADLSKICAHHIAFFQEPAPVSRYQFITLLTDNAFGGLEHISSTALMYSRNDLPSLAEKHKMTESYQSFLSLCSHEFFHTWHVKRIKPQELHQASLLTEQYTEQLWIYEGFTSYYDDLSLFSAHVIDQNQYLSVVGQNLTRLLRNKGRFKQSVTESSFDAWTKFYKQDASAINHIVSYYNKGAVIAMCLDLMIRFKSQDQHSLQDVMQFLWQEYGKKNRATAPDVIQQILQHQLKLNLNDFLEQALYSTEELPVAEILAEFGISLDYHSRNNFEDKGGKPAEEPLEIEFGAQFKAADIGIEITQVTEQSAAYQAGLMVGDLVIALNHWQIDKTNLKAQLNNLEVNQSFAMHILRDKKLKQLSFTAQQAAKDTLSLRINDPELCQLWLSN